MNLRTEEKEKKEYVAIILDESGSMMTNRNETLNGVNEQIQELRKTASKINTYVSLVKFNSIVEEVFFNKPIEEVDDIKSTDYIPSGMTAMLDAIGWTVSKLRNEVNENEDDVSYLLVIVSDGQENSSREYGWQSTKKMIEECDADNKWTITYMGANQDLWQISNELGINSNNITLFSTNSAANVQLGMDTVTRGISNYRMARVENTAASLEKQAFYSSIGSSITDSDDTKIDS